ncbi:MAG TPA: hypothetical protein VFX15_02490 [Actinomycetes bacterium]|nr:hypothetical protein [Actinomycetes bacterium]
MTIRPVIADGERSALARPGRVSAFVITLVVASLPFLAAPAASAVDDGIVSGFAYRDLDDDGIHDGNEPGLPGIVMRSGTRSTITDATGYYEFSGVTSAIHIRADAGWFRSQCRSAFSGPSNGSSYTDACPDPGSGAGVDQDFRVDNQLLSATAEPGTDTSLGLTPDWKGRGYRGYSTDPAAAVAKDPALRLSPGYRMSGADVVCQNLVCRPAETQWVLGQWLNQGTKTLRGIRSVIVAPAGSTITQVTPYIGHSATSGHPVTGYTVIDPSTTSRVRIAADGTLAVPERRVKIRIGGQLLPASEYLLAVAFTMDDDAAFSDGNLDGIPDCSADTGTANPGQTCKLGIDSALGSYVAWGAVTALKRGKDADAAFCPNIPNDCPALGVHNKTQPGDSNDSGSWKVDSEFAP